MDLRRLLRQPIVLHEVETNDAVLDGMGDPTTTTIDHTFKGWIWQESTTEDTANTSVATGNWKMAIERSAAPFISEGSRITYVDGRDYEIDGEPWQARNPRTSVIEYVLATVKRTR